MIKMENSLTVDYTKVLLKLEKIFYQTNDKLANVL